MNARSLLVASLLVTCFTSIASATVTVTAGNHNIRFDNPAQVIQILISSDIAQGIQSADLGLQINDGIGGPLIASVDMTSPGTIFGDAPAGNAGQSDFEAYPTLNQLSSVATNSGDTPANGVLANVTIDTSGIGGVSIFPFRLTYAPFFLPTSTSSIPFQPTIVIDGTILVSPEPGSLVLGGFAMGTLGLLAVRRSRRRNQ